MFSRESLSKLKAGKKRWEDKHSKLFKEERKREFITAEGINIRRNYTPLDLDEKGFDYSKDLGMPGDYPFTRGIDPIMYRRQHFETGQFAGISSPEETNKLFKKLIAAGNEEIHLALDWPSMLCLDSDDPRAKHDVGKGGVAIDSLEDVEIVFDGIDLSRIEVTLVISSPLAIIFLAMHQAVAEKQGHPLDKVRGVLQNDCLGGFTVAGQYVYSPKHALRLTTDSAVYCCQYLPQMYPFNVFVSAQYADAGANRVQVYAFGFSAAMEYIRAAIRRGVDIDTIAPRMMFLGSVGHRDFLVEVAKVRAMRRLWARLMKEEFGAKKPESCMYRDHCGTYGVDMTRDLLEMNIVRFGLATLVKAFAGVQSVGGKTYDEPLGIPSVKALVTSIRTIQLVTHETGVGDTVDPLAGSYYIEWLTSEIEQKTREMIRQIDSMGGIVKAIEDGFVQKEITKSARESQRRIDSKEDIRIGENMFVPEEATTERRDYYKPDLKVREKQTSKLAALKKRRDNQKVKEALENIRKAARKEESSENNLMFPILEAVKAYATVGEIRAALTDVFGEYRLPVAL